jgi:hypothetical protein
MVYGIMFIEAFLRLCCRRGNPMKSVMAIWMLMMLLAMPVHAGQGTIEETETAIIVEYTGDAKDLPIEKALPEVAATSQKKPSAELQTAKPEVVPPVPVKTDMSVREAKAGREEAQRQKELRAATRSTRQGSPRQPRNEDE